MCLWTGPCTVHRALPSRPTPFPIFSLYILLFFFNLLLLTTPYICRKITELSRLCGILYCHSSPLYIKKSFLFIHKGNECQYKMPQSRDYSGFFDLRHIQGVVNDIKYFFLNIEKELEKREGGGL